MDKEEARQHAAVLLAWADGKQIQYMYKRAEYEGWKDLPTIPTDLAPEHYHYRIKPNVRQYRRWLCRPAACKSYVQLAYAPGAPELVEGCSGFIRWIDTEWQEHEE